jgi:hypothetical protein
MRHIFRQITQRKRGRANARADACRRALFPLNNFRNILRRRRGTRGLTTFMVFGLGLLVAQAHAERSVLAQTAAIRAEAVAYEHGEGVTKDSKRAVELYCRAARLGDPEAQFSLGWIFANGRGVPRDDAFAATLFGMAAKQGHDYAKNMLQHLQGVVRKAPECLSEGSGFDPDAESLLAVLAKKQKKLFDLVGKLAPEYHIDPQLALAVIRAESNFNPNARSSKNAQGLMQLIPETSERFNVSKPYDPVQNLRGGLAYLRWLLAYFQGNVALATAGYNAGEGAVDRYRGVPPYAETRAYVKRIREIFKSDHHPFDPSITEPSPELGRIAPAVSGKPTAVRRGVVSSTISASRLVMQVSR